jgi:hypothetical protein
MSATHEEYMEARGLCSMSYRSLSWPMSSGILTTLSRMFTRKARLHGSQSTRIFRQTWSAG